MNECVNCKWHAEVSDNCMHPNNTDRILATEQRAFGKLSQMWYKSCGKEGLWFENIVPEVPEVPKDPEIPGLVKFKDGKYAVRKGKEGEYKFLDLVSPTYWWAKDSDHFKDCLGTRDQISQVLNDASDFGDIV